MRKQAQTITADDVTATYGDTDKSVSATADDGAISYAVKNGSEDYIEVNASTGALTIKKAGTATIVVTAAETDTHAAAAKEVTVTINKADSAAATVTADSLTYDGTDKPLVTVDNATLVGGMMQYKLGENGTYGTNIPTAANAGDYTVYYKVAGDTNHNDTAEASVNVTISPKDIAGAVITLEKDEAVYTGSELTAAVTKVMLGETELTAGDYELDAASETAAAESGEYTIKLNGKGNYTGEASKAWKITKAQLTVTELPTASEIRAGSALSSSKLTGGKVMFGENEVTGKFSWADGTVTPTVNDSNTTEYEVIFTPDSSNFEAAAAKIKLTVRRRSSGGGGGGGAASSATAAPAATEAPKATETPKATEAPEAQPTAQPEGDKWFKDVPEGLWYYAPIKESFDNGRMTGIDDEYFEPETDITRGMFAYAVYRREGMPEAGAQNKFEDVKAETYYETAIAWAAENGIVAGIDDTHYAPDDKITREQMAAILYRYAQFKGYDVSVGEDSNISDFTDAQDISEYAVPAVQWAVGEKIITGFEDMTMRPQDNATRAQMAVILNGISDMF